MTAVPSGHRSTWAGKMARVTPNRTTDQGYREAGYGAEEPLIVGLDRPGHGPVFVAQGATRTGEPLRSATVTYAASLAKQITAACAALLVRDGALEIEDPLAKWLPELPAWAASVQVRHLLWHTAALPDQEVEAILGTADRTTPAVLSALRQIPMLGSPPGVAYAYSGAGYICLAVAVERAAAEPLAVFAESRVFAPLAMSSTRYWPGPAPRPPGAAPLGAAHPAPLSLGDGGVWSTARDLLRWGQALNADELGVCQLMESPGRLDDAHLSATPGGWVSAPSGVTGYTGTAVVGPAFGRCSPVCRT